MTLAASATPRPEGDVPRTVLLGLLVLLPGARAPWIGPGALGISARLLLVALAARATATHRE